MIMNCSPSATPFFCPTKWQIWRQIMALLPRGRAWQTHDDFIERAPDGVPAQVGTFEVGRDGVGYEPNLERLTVAQQFWAGFAEVLEYLHQRACALIQEFFCSTVNETRDAWWREYGFPDPCDPWTRLCDKVRAQGGSTCAYLSMIAADRGWDISCSDCEPRRSAVAGCASAGCAKTCGCVGNTIWVVVHVRSSPSWVAPAIKGAKAGMARAGSSVAAPCAPEAEPLQCLIERYKPAHVKAIYIYEGVI